MKPPVNNFSWGWLLSVALLSDYTGTAVAAEAQEVLVRGLWSLTTQAEPITPRDVQRALRINPTHYVRSQESPPWDAVFSLTVQYRNEGAATDSVTDIPIGLGEFVVLDGPPRDVGTRQKVKIILRGHACVSSELLKTIVHIAPAGATTLQFKSVTGGTQSSLDLDSDCAESVLITKLITPPPLSGSQ